MMRASFLSAFVLAMLPFGATAAQAQDRSVDPGAKAMLERIASGIGTLATDRQLFCGAEGQVVGENVTFACIERSEGAEDRAFSLTFKPAVYNGYQASVTLGRALPPLAEANARAFFGHSQETVRTHFNDVSTYRGTFPATIKPQFATPQERTHAYSLWYLATPGNYALLLSVGSAESSLSFYVGVLG